MLENPIEHIIFDWNGTLIDDLALAVRGVNHVGASLGVAPIDKDTYRRNFGFPIRDFYTRIGFNFEKNSFEAVMAQYLSLFDSNVRECDLQPGVKEVISWARMARMSVSILSASHEEILQNTLRHHGLETEFDHLMGLQNTTANGKLAIAAELDAKLGHPGKRALMVGDTVHDLDVANAHGWQTVIITRGHQGPEHFSGQDVFLISDLHALTECRIAKLEDTDIV
ncbi:MAG: HAD family hydrolase [Aquabacterium sp.]